MLIDVVRTALRRPYTFVVLALVLMSIGPLAALRMPTDIFPEIRIPVIAVAWQYTGLPPEQMVGRIATGYVYYVSLKGVTGAGHIDTEAVAQAVPRIKAHVKVPVGVGFGIRDAESARAVAQVSDAVVIGSALVQLLETQTRTEVAAAAGGFITGIREALDR
jgi:tryptophan synthase alpha subunit